MSPSHQVCQTCGRSGVVNTPPSHNESGPTVALTAVPAKIATSSPQTPATLSSGRPLRTSLRIRYAATTTSSVFPIVCPSAEPTGSVLY